MAMPNKLYEYLHAGLRLVVSDARALAEFVLAHELGEVFRSGDVVDLARAIRAAVAGRNSSDASARRELVRSTSWQSQERTIAALYQRLAPVPPRVLSSDFPPLEIFANPAATVHGKTT